MEELWDRCRREDNFIAPSITRWLSTDGQTEIPILHYQRLRQWESSSQRNNILLFLWPQILESSQTLLSVLKREAGNLTKATASDQKSSGGKDS